VIKKGVRKKLRSLQRRSTHATIVRYAKSYNRRNRTAPTIERFCTKFKITKRRFYELFPKGLEEVCGEAGIPIPPRIHMADRANDNRRVNGKSMIRSQSVEQQESEPDPQLKPLVDANARTRADLSRNQKEIALMKEGYMLRFQLKGAKKHRDALIMVQDRKLYVEKMLSYASEYPAIEQIDASIEYVHGPLTTEQLRTEKERIFAERFDILACVIKAYPYYMKLVGRDGAYEVGPDFIDTELQAVHSDLRLDANVKRYTRCYDMKPAGVCARDGTRVRYQGNGVFVCQNGHQTVYQCPECASTLEYFPEYNEFNCHHCFNKLFDS
jgi:hypothetical protein